MPPTHGGRHEAARDKDDDSRLGATRQNTRQAEDEYTRLIKGMLQGINNEHR